MSRKTYIELTSGTVLATENPEHFPDCKVLPRKEGERRERAEALEKLRKWFPKGSTVYTILRKVSASGMQRTISVLCLTCSDGQVIDLHPNHAVAVLTGRKLKTGGHDGIVCNGCGMDMGFDLAYSLSCALHDGDGYALKHKWL